MSSNLNLLFGVIAILALDSCISNTSTGISADKIDGLYGYEYPNGQYEVISLDSNYSYEQTLYDNKSSFAHHNKPAYANIGTWQLINGELEFENWLRFCYMYDVDSMLQDPYSATIGTVRLRDNSKDGSLIISFYYETGYEFVRIK
jgi:hypothetical protein